MMSKPRCFCAPLLLISLTFLLPACDEKKEVGTAGQQKPAEIRGVRWAEGQRYDYAFSVETQVEIAEAPTGRLEVKGILELLRARDGGSKGTWLAARLRKVEFEPAPGAEKSQYDPLKAELEGAASAVRYEHGKIAEQLLHVGATPIGANLLRTLFAQLQVAPGPAGTTHQEVDATGAYEAVYEKLPSGEVRKSKKRYTRVNVDGFNRGSNGAAPAPVLGEAQATYKIQKNELRSVHLEEKVRSEVDGKAVLEATNKVSLDLTGTQRGEHPKLADIRAKTAPWPLDESRLGSGQSGQLDSIRVAEIDYDAAVQRLLELRKETNGGDFSGASNGAALDDETRLLRRQQLTEYQRNFDALTAHIRIAPSTVQKVRARLEKAPPEEQGLLVDALGAAGTPEAQRVLLEIAGDDAWPLRIRGNAANRAARANQPLPELEETLLVLARHPRLAEYGLFALGTLSRRLREINNAERAAEVDDLLLEELKTAKTDAVRRRVLLGMSNAGSARLRQAIEGYISSEETTVATAAATALRLDESPEASKVLMRALRDERRAVRRQAFDAIKTRSATAELVGAVLALVQRGDPADGIAGTRLLGGWQRASSQARAALVLLSETAPTPKLMAAAREQLAKVR